MKIVRTFVSNEHGETQEQIACPLCESSAAELVLEGQDLLFRRPGRYPLVRCEACGLKYVNPRPTPEELGRHYPNDYFGYEVPEEDAPWFSRWLLSGFARGIALRRIRYLEKVTGRIGPDAAVADVGCGMNRLLYTLKKMRGCEGIGVDFKPEVVEYVRGRLGMPIVQGNLKEASFRDGQFDVMTFLEYIEHEPDPGAVLSEARRVTRSGGHIVIEIPDPSGWVARTFGRYWWNLDVPRHLVFFDPDTLAKQLSICGFELISVKPFTLPFYVGASVLQVLGQRHWRKNKLWMPMIAGLLGAPFLPFQPLMPEFLFTVARAK